MCKRCDMKQKPDRNAVHHNETHYQLMLIDKSNLASQIVDTAILNSELTQIKKIAENMNNMFSQSGTDQFEAEIASIQVPVYNWQVDGNE